MIINSHSNNTQSFKGADLPAKKHNPAKIAALAIGLPLSGALVALGTLDITKYSQMGNKDKFLKQMSTDFDVMKTGKFADKAKCMLKDAKWPTLAISLGLLVAIPLNHFFKEKFKHN